MEHILSQSHILEVRKYMSFFEHKRKESLNEIQTAFSQCLKKSSTDEILSWAEVESLILGLKDEIRITMDSELQNIVYMSGVYIKILMSQAETQGLQLQADISFIENEKAIEEMRNIGSLERDLTKKTQGARLPTLQAGAINEQNSSLKVRELSDERDSLKKKILEQQATITQLLEELNRFKANNESALKTESLYESEVKEVSQALEETKVWGKKLELRTKEELISSLKQEQEKRLADSKQFQSLKKLIQSKNDQIKELREQ